MTVTASEGETIRLSLMASVSIPSLLLQRPGRGMKADGVRAMLERRLNWWKAGNLPDLMSQAKLWASKAQARKLPAQPCPLEEDDGAPMKVSFAETIRQSVASGKLTRAADLLLRPERTGGPVPISDTVADKLGDLHPRAREPVADPPPLSEHPPPGRFDDITAEAVRAVALKLRGASGPSGLPTDTLRMLCRSQGPSSDHLCETIAASARRIASTPLPPGCLGPLIQSRLVTLDKGGGAFRPVGIGEALRRLICKLIMLSTRGDLKDACGAVQTCSGLSGGCEAAAQALQKLWDDPEFEMILLIDARNAFNSMSRSRALKTAWGRCPSLGNALQNFYGTEAKLHLGQGKSILSRELGCL